VTSLVESAISKNELQIVLYELVEYAPHRRDVKQLTLTLSQRPGWTAKDSQTLDDFAHQEAEPRDLELLTTECDPFLDPVTVTASLGQAIRRTCFLRRRTDGRPLGTGFLVGRDQVLTCYHVVECDVGDATNGMLHLRGGLEAVFDFRCSADGVEPDQARLPAFRIAADREVPYAPYSDADRTLGDPQAHEPFALLTLAGFAGETRGHFQICSSEAVPDPERRSPVFIVQHPGHPPPPGPATRLLPLRVTFAQPGIVGLNSNKTRLIYFNGTLPGSSGSPVFDRAGRIVAMHHNRGEFADATRTLAKNNRGVPIRAIVHALNKQGIRSDGTSGHESVQPGSLETDDGRPAVESSLSSMTESELAEFVRIELGERADDIAAWARESLTVPVLLRWAKDRGRDTELRTAVMSGAGKSRNAASNG
jgi:hypothetical protein